MGSHSSPDEVRAKSVAVFGEELGLLHYELSAELVELWSAWQQYTALYVDSEEAVGLLNRTAPRFFFYTQRMFEDGILLRLCRLTDPVSTYSKQNLTVQRLPDLMSSEPQRDAVRRIVDAAVESTAFARDHRNRRIAHRDLLVARNKHPKPLESATLEKFRAGLAAVVGCLNGVSLLYGEPECRFGVVEGSGGAKALLHYLERGRKHLDEERRGWGLGPP